MFATTHPTNKIGAGDVSKDAARETRRRRGATKLVIGLVAGVLALSAMFAAPADAAVAPHGSSIECVHSWCIISAWSKARNSWGDYVYWYPRLQYWNGTTWQTASQSAPLNTWQGGFARDVDAWNWNYEVHLNLGYYYRLLSFFGWYNPSPLNPYYQTTGEASAFTVAN